MAPPHTPKGVYARQETRTYELLSGSLLDVLEELEANHEVPACCWSCVREADTLFAALQASLREDSSNSLLAYRIMEASHNNASYEGVRDELATYQSVLDQIAVTKELPTHDDMYWQGKDFLRELAGDPYKGYGILFED